MLRRTVVYAGYTSGSWNGGNLGGKDQIVVKLDAEGQEQWRYQVGLLLLAEGFEPLGSFRGIVHR